jgi:alkanesulfonate monooxygenase SsuD/methylene tetrahydromethanopterin reductase-like flavin-dependent oxidoreductase (luciferase family)
VASIDRYSDGRFLLGLGTGGASQLEVETSGGRWDRRWAYTMELLRMYEDAGVDRIAFSLPPVETVPDARDAIEKLGEILL